MSEKKGRNEFDEIKVLELYKTLNLDISSQLSMEVLGREYQELMSIVETECYTTTAYLSR